NSARPRHSTAPAGQPCFTPELSAERKLTQPKIHRIFSKFLMSVILSEARGKHCEPSASRRTPTELKWPMPLQAFSRRTSSFQNPADDIISNSPSPQFLTDPLQPLSLYRRIIAKLRKPLHLRLSPEPRHLPLGIISVSLLSCVNAI